MPTPMERISNALTSIGAATSELNLLTYQVENLEKAKPSSEVSELHKRLAARDDKIDTQDRAITYQNGLIRELGVKISEQADTIVELKYTVDTNDRLIADLHSQLAERRCQITEQADTIGELLQQITDLKAEAARKDERLQNQKDSIHSLYKQIEGLLRYCGRINEIEKRVLDQLNAAKPGSNTAAALLDVHSSLRQARLEWT